MENSEFQKASSHLQNEIAEHIGDATAGEPLILDLSDESPNQRGLSGAGFLARRRKTARNAA